MAKPLYYVVLHGKWRSMRPPIWMSFAQAMAACLEHQTQEPDFEDYGKPVYGRPSRVKMGQSHTGKVIYWSEEPHLLIRTPDDWKLEDWKFEALDASGRCEPKDVPPGPDIFDLILQK